MAAQIAGIMAAKQTATLIPLAHPIAAVDVDVRFEWRADGALRIEAAARTAAQTGVEMEAMVAAAVAALTIYDMAKALDKGIDDRVASACSRRRGGKSGTGARVSVYDVALIVLSDRAAAGERADGVHRGDEGAARRGLRDRARDRHARRSRARCKPR